MLSIMISRYQVLITNKEINHEDVTTIKCDMKLGLIVSYEDDLSFLGIYMYIYRHIYCSIDEFILY